MSKRYKAILTSLLLVVLNASLLSAQPNRLLPENSPFSVLLAQTDAQGAENYSSDEAYRDSDIQPKPFDREVWNKKRNGIDYSSKKKIEEEATKDTPTEKHEDKRNNEDEANGNFNLNLGPVGQLILIVGVIAALALLVFTLVKLGFLDSNTSIANGNNGPVRLDEIEDNLHESDLEKALRLALEAKDYRMAIRLYYLSVIKELSLRDWIKWKRDKTNGQYVREMYEKPEGKTFRQLTLAFERVWYSDEVIVLKHYEILSPQFQTFISSIKKR